MHVSKDLMWRRESEKTCNLNQASVLYPHLSGSPAISYTTPDSCHSRLLRLVLSSESWSSLVMVRLRSVPLGASGNKLQTSNECLSPRLSLNSKTYLEYTVHHYTVGRHASMCGVRASLCIITVWFACQIANALENNEDLKADGDETTRGSSLIRETNFSHLLLILY